MVSPYPPYDFLVGLTPLAKGTRFLGAVYSPIRAKLVFVGYRPEKVAMNPGIVCIQWSGLLASVGSPC